MKTLKSLFMMLFLFGALLVARAASAQDATPRPVTADDVNRIAKKLFCPVCENVPLDVCPTQACAQWRATIREKLAAGWSEPQILASSGARHGEGGVPPPPPRGRPFLVWITPPLALAAGAFVLWRFLRQMAR